MVACELSRRHPPEALLCPRCDSAETKFCYYNNYNTSQPRHFCKTCKRYWTAGGTLRNVPVGGGLRKNKKCKLLNHVKDMILSSSTDELFHGNLPHPTPPYAISHHGFPYDAPRPLSFAPPLFMISSSSSADVAGNGTLENPHTFRNTNPLDSGYLAESFGDGDYASSGIDPPLFNSVDVRQYAPLYHGDQGSTFPEVLEPQRDVIRHWPTALDQAQSYSGDVSEVRSELSQASSEALKDSQMAHSVILQAVQLEPGREGPTATHQSTCEPDQSQRQGTSQTTTKELKLLADSQCRDMSSTEGEDDELGNVVNVRYPYDWEQVSEVLFGGTPDFFQLPGY